MLNKYLLSSEYWAWRATVRTTSFRTTFWLYSNGNRELWNDIKQGSDVNIFALSGIPLAAVWEMDWSVAKPKAGN